MRHFLIALLVVLGACVSVARVVELEDKDGRVISAEIISLKDGVLTLRRTQDMALFQFPVALLSESSVRRLHDVMTETVVPTLSVKTLANSRATETHWRNYWGDSSKTTKVTRTFEVRVHSTSSFVKQVDVYLYWYDGTGLKYEKIEVEVGGGKDFVRATSHSASQHNVRIRESSYSTKDWRRYTSGTDEVEAVFLVKDKSGKVIASWSTMKNVEAMVLADPPRD